MTETDQMPDTLDHVDVPADRGDDDASHEARCTRLYAESDAQSVREAADAPPMKRWLWYFRDWHGPWFGIVVADNIHAAERLVRLRMADECEAIESLRLQECEKDDCFTMAKGYL